MHSYIYIYQLQLSVNWKYKFRCMQKHEVLSEHNKTWKQNGLKDLHFEVKNRDDSYAPCVSRIKVDICLNNHWSDDFCGINNNIWGNRNSKIKS